MLKSLIGKAIRIVDEAGVETVLTLAFIAQVAAYTLPLQGSSDLRTHLVTDERLIVETGTVVQMPGNPNGGRAARAVVVRQAKGSNRLSAAAAAKAIRPSGTLPQRVRNPQLVGAEPADDLDQLRGAENSVRITIIGPDGQPRTKVVRLSGSRDGMTAPTRRPHD
jgi:hypothetical protein